MTKLETAKNTILSTTSTFTVKSIQEGSEISIDTFRKALNQLVEEGQVIPEETKGSYSVKKEELQVTPDRTKKGWKMKFIVESLSKYGTMSRLNICQLIDSDEKNTHIMVGKINQKAERKEETYRITYNKEDRSYTYVDAE